MNRLRITLAGLVIALASYGVGQEGGKWALIIGIDRYQSEEMNPLRYAVADAKALANALAENGYGRDRVIVMTSESVGDEVPSRKNVLDRLTSLAGRVGPGDTFVFYFSGHGYSREGQNFLATIECDPSDLDRLKRTCISTQDLKSKFADIRAKTAIAIFDACRNNPERGKGDGDNKLQDDFAKDIKLVLKGSGEPSPAAAAALLFACSEGERAYEWPEKGHGVFTQLLIEGLKGAAAEPATSEVTAGSLMAYVGERVAHWSDRSGKRQTPWMDAPARRIVVAKSANPSAATGGVAPDTSARIAEQEASDSRAMVKIVSEPLGAHVRIDGAASGKLTPCTIEIDLGELRERQIELEVELRGFTNAVTDLKIQRGLNEAPKISLAKDAPPPPSSQARANKVEEQRQLRAKIDEAIRAYKEGRLEEGRARLAALYAEHPDNTDVQFWLGAAYLRTGIFDKAVVVLEAAARSMPRDTNVWLNLGSAYAETGQAQKALAAFGSALAINNRLATAYFNRGNIYLELQEYDRAIDEFEKAVALDKNDAVAWNNLGFAFHGAKGFLEAADAFGKAAALQPKEGSYARNAGLMYIKMRRSSQALPHLERANGLDPYDSVAAVNLANAYAEAGDKTKAIQKMESVRRFRQADSIFWYNLGYLKSQTGDKAGAIEAYRNSVFLNSKDSDATNNLALLLFEAGSFAEAATHFEMTVANAPTNMNARMNLGAAAARAGDWPRAIKAYRDILALGDRKDARIQLANALTSNREYAAAREQFQAILATDPASAEAHNGIGLVYLRESKPQPAEAAFRAAIQANSGYAPAHANLGTLLLKGGKADEAEKMFRRATELEPSEGSYHADLAAALARLNRKTEAVAAAQKARSLGVTSHPVYAELGLGR